MPTWRGHGLWAMGDGFAPQYVVEHTSMHLYKVLVVLFARVSCGGIPQFCHPQPHGLPGDVLRLDYTAHHSYHNAERSNGTGVALRRGCVGTILMSTVYTVPTVLAS
jgi:hypothetical protein